MSGPDAGIPWAEVEAWIAFAEKDRQAAAICLAADPPLPDVAAFHCQQAGEKLLKGFLVRAGHPVRRTHDLAELGDQVAALFPSVADRVRAMETWTVWSNAYRYPSEDVPDRPPSRLELQTALDAIDRLAQALRSLKSNDEVGGQDLT